MPHPGMSKASYLRRQGVVKMTILSREQALESALRSAISFLNHDDEIESLILMQATEALAYKGNRHGNKGNQEHTFESGHKKNR